MGENDFSFQLGVVLVRCGRVGCGFGVMQQFTCLVFGAVVLNSNAAFLDCAPVGQVSGSVVAPVWAVCFSGWGRGFLSVNWLVGGSQRGSSN